MNTSHYQVLFYRSISLTLVRHQAIMPLSVGRQRWDEVNCLKTKLDSSQVRIPAQACLTLLA